MDDKDPGGGSDQQPPSYNSIHMCAAARPIAHSVLLLSLTLRSL